VSLWRPSDETELASELARMAAAGESTGAIARGLGRAYGDAAQLRRGLVVQTEGLHRWQLDAERGVLSAQAGVSAAELMRELIPRGFVLPVLPGTQHVSIGGMIASDVHGKNHGVVGSFGRHVLSIGLLRSDGEVLELAPDEEAFQATLGGMGLTGVILWAQIALRRVAGPIMTVDTDRAEGLGSILELLQLPGGSHRVAWLDLLSGASSSRIRGVVTRAEFAEADQNPGAHESADVATLATVPSWWPGGLPPLGVRAFNELRFRTSPAHERGRLEPVGRHMFPLDRLGAWPRLYGPPGFVQYQLVVPPGAEATLERVLETLSERGVPCFLAVLKDFGPASGAPLSFPIPGWTLALDLPRAAPALAPALRRCDELVAEAGGRVYLSKDSRMAPDVLAAMYPRLDEWRQARDALDPIGRWRSDLGLRLGLVAAAGPGSVPSAGAVGSRPAALSEDLDGGPEPAAAPGPESPPRTGGGEESAARVLLLGGTSEIGLAVVRRLALDRPVRALLLGRAPERLQAAAEELRRAAVNDVGWERLDALEPDAGENVLERALERLGGCDVAILALGVLGAQQGLDADLGEAREVLELNAVGAGMLMLRTLRALRAQGHGTLIVLSSVAAERPRAGNAVYGAAKAALDALAQGLSDSLPPSEVRVLVVRPGFVHTKMTAGLDPAPLSTSAEAVAEATVAGLKRGAHTVWVPGSLRYVFAILRHLPRPLYRRLPL
jgi:decaprenylphospho-beta-D-ribofuranose 2-oxidase